MYEMSWYDVMNPASMLAVILTTMLWLWIMIRTTYKDLKVIMFFIGCFALAGVYEPQSSEARKYQKSLEYAELLKTEAEAYGYVLNPYYQALLDDYKESPYDPKGNHVVAYVGSQFNLSKEDHDLVNRFLADCISEDEHRIIHVYPVVRSYAIKEIKSAMLSEAFIETDKCRVEAGTLFNILVN